MLRIESRIQSIGIRNVRLRRELNQVRENADAMIRSLAHDESAANALGELWASGEFECGPQDYDFIVERCLTAISLLKNIERHTCPAPSLSDRDFGDESNHIGD